MASEVFNVGGGMAVSGGAICAHSPNSNGLWHSLDDHLRGTAELASRFAKPFGGDRVAWWLGLLHDAGKASCEWQARLREVAGTDRPVGRDLDHKLLGARLARERGLGSLALAIAGHHGGLTSAESLADRLGSLTEAERSREADAMAALEPLLPELVDGGGVPLPEGWRERLVREMAVRLCFSVLCDADFLDTSAHFSGSAPPSVRAETDFAALRDRYEQSRRRLLAARPRSSIDEVREEVYRACVRSAASEPGVFRLALSSADASM